ncbi:MAG: hypothetical protein U0903_01610 [Planctomycetales bacterium]
MRTWTLCSLCALLTCLGCGTMSYNRTNRPLFTNPPLGNGMPLMQPPLMNPAPSPLTPSATPTPVTPPALPSGPSLNSPTGKSPGQVGAARVSRYRTNNLTKASNPPPVKGYVELGPPQEKNALSD